MPRANRNFITGHVWHITHRCHKREFLLKFAHDRQRYTHWLFEARKRFGVEVLNYAITSNHTHLLVRDADKNSQISNFVQLVAGRTGQEYNVRKERKGAFWEDRYHATAIETGEHLQRCLVYIDLNMVRAGVVSHPEDWAHGGYHEIQGTKRRNRIIDADALLETLEFDRIETLREAHRGWITEQLKGNSLTREDFWSRSLAVGSAEFVINAQKALGLRGRYRTIADSGNSHVLREPEEDYGPVFGGKNGPIGGK